jgi:hypothetical protein
MARHKRNAWLPPGAIITDKQGKADFSCPSGKRRYKTKERARQGRLNALRGIAEGKMANTGKVPIRAYFCPTSGGCGGWHLTSKPEWVHQATEPRPTGEPGSSRNTSRRAYEHMLAESEKLTPPDVVGNVQSWNTTRYAFSS